MPDTCAITYWQRSSSLALHGLPKKEGVRYQAEPYKSFRADGCISEFLLNATHHVHFDWQHLRPHILSHVQGICGGMAIWQYGIWAVRLGSDKLVLW